MMFRKEYFWDLLRTLRRWIRLIGFFLWSGTQRFVFRRDNAPVRVYGGLKIWVSARDYRGYRVWQTRGSQKDKVRIIEGLSASGPSAFFDIGANYGEFSIMPASMGIHCLMFEPNPLVFPLLQRTMALYPKAHPSPDAVGSSCGHATFSFCRSASGSGSLAAQTPMHEARYLGRIDLLDEVNVGVTTIDQVAKSQRLDLSKGVVLKIDVEGFEREVMTGAMGVLSSTPWWRALVEFSPAALRNAGKDVAQEWEFFRQFSGVVAENGVPDNLQNINLPHAPPGRDVDLLLGRGEVPSC